MNIHLQYAATCSSWFLVPGFFYPEDGGDTFLRNVGSYKIYTAPHPKRQHSSERIESTKACIQWQASVIMAVKF
jgi:hypothetical protein